jgi:hypothetical protein
MNSGIKFTAFAVSVIMFFIVNVILIWDGVQIFPDIFVRQVYRKQIRATYLFSDHRRLYFAVARFPRIIDIDLLNLL